MELKETALSHVDENEKQNFKRDYSKISTDSVLLAYLFTKSYSTVKNKIEDFIDKDKVNEILSSFSFVKQLFEELEEYGKGMNWGDSVRENKIKFIVDKHKIHMLEFIDSYKNTFINNDMFDF